MNTDEHYNYAQAAYLTRTMNQFLNAYFEHDATPRPRRLPNDDWYSQMQGFMSEQGQYRLMQYALGGIGNWSEAAVDALQDNPKRLDDAVLAKTYHLSMALEHEYDLREAFYTCDTCGHDARNGKHDIPILGARYYEPPEDWYRCEPHLDYNLADEYPELDY